MEELLTVSGLSKTFHLSKKQQKLEKTTEKVKIAADGVDVEIETNGVYYE